MEKPPASLIQDEASKSSGRRTERVKLSIPLGDGEDAAATGVTDLRKKGNCKACSAAIYVASIP
jgi:hypothetical protein